MLEDIGPAARSACYHKAVQRLQVYVHVTVTEHLVLKAAVTRKIGIQGKEGRVFLCCVGEIGPGSGCLLILRNLLPGSAVVLLGSAVHAQLELYVGPVHIGLGKVRVQLDCLVVVGKGVVPAFHLYKVAGAVEVCKDVAGIDGQHPVHIGQGSVIISHLGAQKTPVV